MELFSTALVLLLSVIILTWIWLKSKFGYWSKRGIYTPPYIIPFGHMKDVLVQNHSFAEHFLKMYANFKAKGLKYGGLYTLWSPSFIPIDVDIIKSVMQIDFQHFVDRGMYVNEKTDPLSTHLFSLEGKKWKLLRNKLTPTFTSGKMKMMFDTILASTRGFYKVMDSEEGNAVDIKDIAGRYTTDVIGSCAFGLDCNSFENPQSEFRVKGKAVFHRSFIENIKSFILFTFPDFGRCINLKAVPKDIDDFFIGIVQDTVAYREKNNISRKDFMHLLIQLKNEGRLVDDEKMDAEHITDDENKITLAEIVAQAFIFFEAGFETSSTAMTFCLYELAKNHDIQSKVRDEIKKVLSKHDGKLTYEAALDMHYLEQTINESLRKYPPVPTLQRICTKDYRLPGTDIVLEKGMKVVIPIIGIHRDPDYYPNPEKFDPDRFSEENRNSIPTFAFLPFGEGPRICIGNRFGMMQAKVGLVAMLLNYEFSVSTKTKEPIKFDPETFFTSTKGGIWLVFKKIVDQSVDLSQQKT